MDNIILERNPLSDVTIISNVFLDEFMPHAGGEYVKVYLYILRCSTMTSPAVSVTGIADALERTEADITRALRYWEQAGLLSLSFDDSGSRITKIGIKQISSATPLPPVTSQDVKPPVCSETGIPDKEELSSEKMASLVANEDIKELLYISQTYLGKTFSPSETNTILYFYDGLGFPIELIEYLIEYCVSNGHKTMRYIETVALNWAKESIDTVAAAKARVATFSTTFFPVLKALGLQGRNPADAECEYINKWTYDYGFSMDMIIEACNRTITTIHQPSFQYVDSILQRWLKHNVKSLAEIKTLDLMHDTKSKEAAAAKALTRQNTSAATNSFNNFSTQRDYDYAALEKDLLRRR